MFQSLNLTNWNKDENVCEVQQISIEPLQCELNNVTSCSDNFTLSYLDETVTFSLKDTNSDVLEEKLNRLKAFLGWGTVNVTAVNTTEGNATVFRVSFCFTEPRDMEILNGSVADNKTLFLNITRLVQGQWASYFQLVFDEPDLPSRPLKPDFNKQDIEDVFKDWFSAKCDGPKRPSK